MKLMNIVKSINDYVSGPEGKEAVKCLRRILPTDICYVPIKNKEFLKKYFSPVNNFVVHTTALACCEPYRVLNARWH